jgi:hypothetical protein
VRLRVVLIGLISFSLIALPSASQAIQSGDSCKKVGVKKKSGGKTFTCVKKGKKSVWRIQKSSSQAAAPIPTPAPTPPLTVTATPTPVPTPTVSPSPSHSPTSEPEPTPTPRPLATFLPWSTEFNAPDMYLNALKKTQEFFSESTQTQDELTLIIQDTFERSDSDLFKTIGVGAHSIFYPITKQPTTLIFASSPKWAGDQAKRLNLKVNSYELPCGGTGTWDSYCASENYGFMIYNGRYDQARSQNQQRLDFGVGAKSVIAHEYFHTVQSALRSKETRDTASPTYIPTWLYEGSANFIGFSIIDYLKLDKYTDGRFSEVESHQDYKNKEANVSLREFRHYTSTSNGVSLNPYGIGMAATEYIVASTSLQSLLNIFVYTRSSSTFEEAFEKAIGISLNDFYEKFDRARSNFLIGSK